MLVSWGDAYTGLVSNLATHLLSGYGEGQYLLQGVSRLELHDVGQHLLGAAGGGEGQGRVWIMGLASS